VIILFNMRLTELTGGNPRAFFKISIETAEGIFRVRLAQQGMVDYPDYRGVAPDGAIDRARPVNRALHLHAFLNSDKQVLLVQQANHINIQGMA